MSAITVITVANLSLLCSSCGGTLVAFFGIISLGVLAGVSVASRYGGHISLFFHTVLSDCSGVSSQLHTASSEQEILSWVSWNPHVSTLLQCCIGLCIQQWTGHVFT